MTLHASHRSAARSARPGRAARALTGALTACVAAAALTACTSERPAEIDGSTVAGPGATAAPGTSPGRPSATATAAATKLPALLSGKDLPTWKEGAVPRELAKDWVSGCDTDAGVAALQRRSRAVQLSGPRGVTFQTRVATYASSSAATDALSAAQSLATGCAIEPSGSDGQRVMSVLAGPAGQRAVGILVETGDASGVVTSSVGYWVAQRGATTVEVRTSGLFEATGTASGTETLSAAILQAALAKADGRAVAPIPLPKRAQASSSDPTSESGDSSPADTTSGPAPGEAVQDWVPPQQPDGVGGEVGPDAIMGPDQGPPLP